ncbi:MAG: hypothetical protein ABIH65_04080 [Nanoarchaeota archaeon]
MAIEDIVLSQIAKINLWIKGLGLFAVIGIIYTIISLIREKKKTKKLENIEKHLNKIEAKIDSQIKRR